MKLEPITYVDYPRLSPFFRDQPHRLCVYSLSSLLAWSTEAYFPVGGIRGDTLLIGADFVHQPHRRHLILPLSPGQEFPPKTLRDLALETGFEHYWFVPEAYLSRFGTDAVKTFFTIEEQPFLNDYIYNCRDLATLKGNRYAKKRNLVHQFERDVAPDRIAIEPVTRAQADGCLAVLDRWCQERDCDMSADEELACERQAIQNALTHIEQGAMKGIALSIDGAMAAFAMASRLTEDMGALHFEKALSSVKGLYQYFDRECAIRLFDGCQYINKESDMGVAGLRKAKRSYHPVMILKSFQLTLR
jgi:hypothetical protein